MRALLLSACLFASGVAADAVSFTFKPNDGQGDTDDVFDLDHHEAYAWGITTGSGIGRDLFQNLRTQGHQIVSAKLTISDIWDWRPEADILYIHLLNDSDSGLKRVTENVYDHLNGDYFLPDSRSGTSVRYSDQIALTTWSDPVGGVNNGFDFNWNFTAAQMATLASWILDGGTFGLGFDPDCHYYNTGIQLEVETAPQSVPDGGMTAAMLGLSLLGVGAVARRFAARA